nr:hypothetical protein Itr_chr03CG03460 [Ipomoea trifida]
MVDDSSTGAATIVVQVSTGAEPATTPCQQQPVMVDDSSTAAATTVQEQPSDSIKEAKAAEVQKYESRKLQKAKHKPFMCKVRKKWHEDQQKIQNQ